VESAVRSDTTANDYPRKDVRRYVGGVEDRRVLQRLVFTFGDREEHGPKILAQVVAGRTHEVADILHEQEVNRGQVPAVGRGGNHVCIEVAYSACRDLLHVGGCSCEAAADVFTRGVTVCLAPAGKPVAHGLGEPVQLRGGALASHDVGEPGRHVLRNL
jgi:hypothetical protein